MACQIVQPIFDEIENNYVNGRAGDYSSYPVYAESVEKFDPWLAEAFRYFARHKLRPNGWTGRYAGRRRQRMWSTPVNDYGSGLPKHLFDCLPEGDVFLCRGYVAYANIGAAIRALAEALKGVGKIGS